MCGRRIALVRVFLSDIMFLKCAQKSRYRLNPIMVRKFSSKSFNECSSGGETRELVKRMQTRIDDSIKGSDNKFHSAWDTLWKDGLTPWNLGEPTPLLIDELHKLRRDETRKGIASDDNMMRTLVPGCGQGYDLLTLADHQDKLVADGCGSVVVGLDVSPTSLDSAQDVLVSNGIHMRRTLVNLQCGNFFEKASSWNTVFENSNHLHDDEYRHQERHRLEELSAETQFDFILDYTFFCAVRPTMRSSWASRMKELLRPSTGQLMTIIFPVLPGDDVTRGPPYPVSVEDCQRVLEPLGITMDSEPFESPCSVASRAGKELVCYWRSS